MKSLLPIILIILVLTGAITYSLSKRSIAKREENRFGIAANQLDSGSIVTPTATPKITPLITPKPSVTPTPSKAVEGIISTLPTVTENSTGTKGGQDTSSPVPNTLWLILVLPMPSSLTSLAYLTLPV